MNIDKKQYIRNILIFLFISTAFSILNYFFDKSARKSEDRKGNIAEQIYNEKLNDDFYLFRYDESKYNHTINYSKSIKTIKETGEFVFINKEEKVTVKFNIKNEGAIIYEGMIHEKQDSNLSESSFEK